MKLDSFLHLCAAFQDEVVLKFEFADGEIVAASIFSTTNDPHNPPEHGLARWLLMTSDGNSIEVPSDEVSKLWFKDECVFLRSELPRLEDDPEVDAISETFVASLLLELASKRR